MTDTLLSENYDVVVLGAGNAALAAAITAQDRGARVLVIERAGENERGGNSRFTAGGFRFAYEDESDILELIPDLTPEELATTDFGSYPKDRFFDDLARVTNYRSDPDLADLLVSGSRDAVFWLRDHGVRFLPSYRRFAFKVDGRYTFWGGVAVETAGGGPGLVESLFAAYLNGGGRVIYDARGVELAYGERVRGIRVKTRSGVSEVKADAVVLASGGFEANPAWRTKYLGQGYDLARVRGTWANTGDGIRMAIEIGAVPYGHWSGAHAVPWDFNAPEFGDLAVGDGFSKLSYPLGVMLNNFGGRFVDEGADFRTLTYARYGHEVLRQPNQQAWQIFDAKVTELLRDEYHILQASRVRAGSIPELATQMEGADPDLVVRAINQYNDAVDDSTPFNPNVKDGKAAQSLDVPKSNWATKLDTPPFAAYSITCGVTFTFGGLRIDTEGRVLQERQRPIGGLYAAGELVGGLFYHNYPGGTGLTSGTVFGRMAGSSATA